MKMALAGMKCMKNNNNKKILYTATVLVMLAAIGVLLFYAPVPISPGEIMYLVSILHTSISLLH